MVLAAHCPKVVEWLSSADLTVHNPDSKNFAQNANGPVVLVLVDIGELHFWPFAKYAIAFPKISRSILTRARSARNWRISI